jgi:L-ribulose-5-phosphate 4-epimerase
MLNELKREVCQANLELVKAGLVLLTWGNASGIDRDRGLMVIKPSGVPYSELTPARMVVVGMADGAVVEGRLRPSSDAPTHRVLYEAFPDVGGVVHTHSLHATAWAQARRDLPALGTTHADSWHEAVPCTRALKPGEIRTEYEANTGRVIVERLAGVDPLGCPGVLVASHGPFTWGRSVADAVEQSIVLEFVARLATESLRLRPGLSAMPAVLREKHFFRKHGPAATYGQTTCALPKRDARQQIRASSARTS